MNITELKVILIKKGNIKIPQLADAIGLSTSTLYSRLNKETTFTYGEMCAIKDYLKLTEDEFNSIFKF